MTADVYVRTYYMSRVVDLPPLVAQAAYDALSGHPGRDPWLLDVPSARLLLRAPVRPPIGAGYQPSRRQRGTVMTGWLRRPVELELLPWSDVRTELGLCLLARAFSRSPPDALVRAGHDLLSRLGEGLLGWAEQPLSDWAHSLSGDPLPVTDSG